MAIYSRMSQLVYGVAAADFGLALLLFFVTGINDEHAYLRQATRSTWHDITIDVLAVNVARAVAVAGLTWQLGAFSSR